MASWFASDNKPPEVVVRPVTEAFNGRSINKMVLAANHFKNRFGECRFPPMLRLFGIAAFGLLETPRGTSEVHDRGRRAAHLGEALGKYAPVSIEGP